MENKICNKCGISKTINNFYKNRGRPESICKACVKERSKNYYYSHKNDDDFKRKRQESKHIYDLERKKTFDGWSSHIYMGMKYRNIQKFNLDLPFSLSEFRQWVNDNYGEIFKQLFQTYIDNNCDKNLVPSVDRIDDYDSYHFDNMQIITWNENNIKGRNGIKNKTSCAEVGRKYCSKTVIQMDSHYNEIQQFISTHEVERILGYDSSLIAKACRKGNKSKGYYWKYKE